MQPAGRHAAGRKAPEQLPRVHEADLRAGVAAQRRGQQVRKRRFPVVERLERRGQLRFDAAQRGLGLGEPAGDHAGRFRPFRRFVHRHDRRAEFEAAVRAPFDLDPAQPVAEFSGREQDRLPDDERLLQQMVRMAAEDEIDAVHLLRQPLVKRQAEMGEDDDDVRRGPQGAHLFGDRLDRVEHPPAELPVELVERGRRARDAERDAALLHDDGRLHPGGTASVRQPDHVRAHDREARMRAVQFIQRVHRPREAFVVPERHRVDGRRVQQVDVDPSARSFRFLPHPVHMVARVEREHPVRAVPAPGFRDMGRNLRVLFQPAVQVVGVQQEHPGRMFWTVSAHESRILPSRKKSPRVHLLIS